MAGGVDFFKTRPPSERGGGRALLNVRTFSWAILLRKIEVFTIPGPALLLVVPKTGALGLVAATGTGSF
jgi:hypothetical protein